MRRRARARACAPPAGAWSWPVVGLRCCGRSRSRRASTRPASTAASTSAGAAGEPVLAPAAGAGALRRARCPRHGRSVTIETPDGYTVTLLHLGSVGVARGASVAEGEQIGTVGRERRGRARRCRTSTSVSAVTGDPDGYVDPLELLPPRAEPSAPVAGSRRLPAGRAPGRARRCRARRRRLPPVRPAPRPRPRPPSPGRRSGLVRPRGPRRPPPSRGARTRDAGRGAAPAVARRTRASRNAYAERRRAALARAVAHAARAPGAGLACARSPRPDVRPHAPARRAPDARRGRAPTRPPLRALRPTRLRARRDAGEPSPRAAGALSPALAVGAARAGRRRAGDAALAALRAGASDARMMVGDASSEDPGCASLGRTRRARGTSATWRGSASRRTSSPATTGSRATTC